MGDARGELVSPDLCGPGNTYTEHLELMPWSLPLAASLTGAGSGAQAPSTALCFKELSLHLGTPC